MRRLFLRLEGNLRRFLPYLKEQRKRLGWGALFFVATLLVVGVGFVPERLYLVEGQPSPRDFKAPRALVYESAVLTKKAQDQAISQVEPAFRLDKEVLPALKEEANAFFARLKELKALPLGEEEKYQRALEAGFSFSLPFFREVMGLEDRELEQAAAEAGRLLESVFRESVPREALPAAREKLASGADSLELPAVLRGLIKLCFEKINLRPNYVFDEAETAKKVEAARNSVAPVFVTVRKGEKIVGEGEILTAEKLEALEHLGLLRGSSSWASFLGLALFLLLSFFLFLIYLYFYYPQVYRKDGALGLLGLIFVSTLLLVRAMTAIRLGATPEVAATVGYLSPVAAGSMLTAVLVDPKLAIFVTFFLGSLTGIITGNQLPFALVAVIGGLAGIYSVSRLTQRANLAISSFYIALANAVAIVALGLIFRTSPEATVTGVAMGVASGILSTVVTIGSLPFLESAFNVTTALRLFELSSAQQPLLNRLMVTAPGTYQHSILVGNLAEAAAVAIGANALLARVGGYYHDVGKIKRPYFFIENQLGCENPHDKLAPTLSTFIITAHVKDGVELAREARLPQAVVDIIAQHHGTCRLAYFYSKAKANGKEPPASLTDFRYETPKPKTKEAALVMLADAVEAGARSLQKPSPKQVENFVRRVVKERLEEGQLDECDLTLRELEAIVQVFTRVINGLLHARVEYPEETQEGKEENAASRP